MDINDWTKQLHELDKIEDIAASLYGKLLNDRNSTQECCDKAHLLCETIQANRFSCQTHIIQHQMGNTNDGSDYDEPIWSSADDQSDEMDALGSIGWAEDEYYG